MRVLSRSQVMYQVIASADRRMVAKDPSMAIKYIVDVLLIVSCPTRCWVDPMCSRRLFDALRKVAGESGPHRVRYDCVRAVPDAARLELKSVRAIGGLISASGSSQRQRRGDRSQRGEVGHRLAVSPTTPVQGATRKRRGRSLTVPAPAAPMSVHSGVGWATSP
jgi:hypothetical protein